MDEKLARGLARDLFRRLAKSSNQETRPSTPAIAKVLHTYLVDGGVDDAGLATMAAGLASAIAGPDDRVETHHVRHLTKRKVIVEATAPARIGGTEQGWMIARSDTWVFQRNVLTLVETVHHLALAEHAIFRIFQRGEMKSFTRELIDRAALWAPTLLLALFGRGIKATADDGTEVAIPFADGLLLGTVETNHFESPDQGPTITKFRRGGHKLRRLKAPFEIGGDSIPTIGINTYVGRHELFDNQRATLDALEQFAEHYRTPMAKMRALCALGYPDAEVAKLLGPARFDEIDANALLELAGHMRKFFQSPEWRRHAEAHRPRVRFMQ